MKISAISAVLVAGSMSLVSAAPVDHESTARLSYSESAARAAKATHAAPHDDGWVELASATPASHGREYIMVGAAAGTFTRLRIDAASGRPTVWTVRVDFKNGARKIMRVGQTLDRRRKRSTILDLRGAHEIEKLVVITDRDSRGSYAVFAEGEPASVAAR